MSEPAFARRLAKPRLFQPQGKRGFGHQNTSRKPWEYSQMLCIHKSVLNPSVGLRRYACPG
jgi:hypothetical protein